MNSENISVVSVQDDPKHLSHEKNIQLWEKCCAQPCSLSRSHPPTRIVNGETIRGQKEKYTGHMQLEQTM
jgi:hypothetical protein